MVQVFGCGWWKVNSLMGGVTDRGKPCLPFRVLPIPVKPLIERRRDITLRSPRFIRLSHRARSYANEPTHRPIQKLLSAPELSDDPKDYRTHAHHQHFAELTNPRTFPSTLAQHRTALLYRRNLCWFSSRTRVPCRYFCGEQFARTRMPFRLGGALLGKERLHVSGFVRPYP